MFLTHTNGAINPAKYYVGCERVHFGSDHGHILT